WVSLSALDFTLPGRAEVLDRDLTVQPAGTVAYLDRFGAKMVRAGGVTALIDDGVDGVVVRHAQPDKGSDKSADKATDREPYAERSVIRVELLSAEARPFLYDARCRADWRQENPKILRPARLRLPGERDLARIALRDGDERLLSKSRWPEGRGAALVI